MAQSDYLLVFDPQVKGESRDHQYKDAIEIDSWSFTGHNTSTHGTGGGGGAGKVVLGDLQLQKKAVDLASATLFERLCDGKHMKTATLHCRKKSGDQALEFLELKLTDVTISSISLGGHGSASGVSESVSLGFSKIEYKYTEQKDDGTKGAGVNVGWDLKQNKAA